MCVELSESKMRDHFCLGLVNFFLFYWWISIALAFFLHLCKLLLLLYNFSSQIPNLDLFLRH